MHIASTKCVHEGNGDSEMSQADPAEQKIHPAVASRPQDNKTIQAGELSTGFQSHRQLELCSYFVS